jgi:CheY-like chemotaxis protein
MAKVILIVEDDPKNLKFARDFLQVQGYVVMEAMDGGAGVKKAREHRPDLILMDIQMPVMDGLKTTGLLKSYPETREIPVIALTAYAMKGDREKMLQAGCDGYVAKPIHLHELLKEVAKFLQK